jgi:hypothetical protein
MSRFVPGPLSAPAALGLRELDFGTVNIFNHPMPVGGPAPFTQIASALVIPLDATRTVEHWVLFQNYVAPHRQVGGPGTAIVMQAVAPSACAPGLSAWTGDDLPTPEEFLAAMADLAATRQQSFTVLEVLATRQT